MADRILLVEDEDDMAETLEMYLQHGGYEVKRVRDQADALEAARRDAWNLILLDVELPSGIRAGFNICKRLREEKNFVPVIFLSVSSEVTLGLDVGADNFLKKPTNRDELIAQVRAAIRRNADYQPQAEQRKSVRWVVRLFGNDIDLDSGENSRGPDSKLTPTECALLKLFLTHPKSIYSNDALLELVWKSRNYDAGTVYRMVCTLRSKIGQADFAQEGILTLRRRGYTFVPPAS